jgi:hypothetical protein
VQRGRGEASFIDPKYKELIRDLGQVCWKTDETGRATTELDKSDRMRTHVSDAGVRGAGVRDAAAALVLITVTLAASYVRAHRASHVDPMETLRNE